MNLEWAKNWLENCFNKGNLAALGTLYSPAVRFEDVTLGVKAEGIDGVRGFLGAFVDPSAGRHQFRPETYVGDARGGVVEWTWEGTLGTRDLFNVGSSAPGKTFRVRGNSVFRFDRDGRVVEERDYWDLATVLRQIGAIG